MKTTLTKKYAVVHKDGILVRGIGNPFVDFATDFSRAMTFGTKKDAQSMADLINKKTGANGGTGKAYSVIEKTAYKKPSWAKSKK